MDKELPRVILGHCTYYGPTVHGKRPRAIPI